MNSITDNTFDNFDYDIVKNEINGKINYLFDKNLRFRFEYGGWQNEEIIRTAKVTITKMFENKSDLKDIKEYCDSYLKGCVTSIEDFYKRYYSCTRETECIFLFDIESLKNALYNVTNRLLDIKDSIYSIKRSTFNQKLRDLAAENIIAIDMDITKIQKLYQNLIDCLESFSIKREFIDYMLPCNLLDKRFQILENDNELLSHYFRIHQDLREHHSRR